MNRKRPKALVTEKGIYLKIYINGLLHFQAERKQISSIQSWTRGTDGLWKIEYCIGNSSTVCEYASESLWKDILTGLDKLFSF